MRDWSDNYAWLVFYLIGVVFGGAAGFLLGLRL